MGKEVIPMMDAVNFVLAVAASILAYYICKWLDDQNRNGR